MKEVVKCVGLANNCGRQKYIIRKISHFMLFSTSEGRSEVVFQQVIISPSPDSGNT